MRLNSFLTAIAAVAFLMTSLTFAQEKSGEVKTLDDQQCQSECNGSCPVSTAMAKLPKMNYQVNGEAVCCSKMAEKAKSDGAKVDYIVGKETFDNHDKAFVSLVKQTETFVNDFVTPSTCSKSGMTTVAGESCNCPVEAGKKAELVKNAVAKVSMTYAVGEETCNCPNQAAAMAKKSGAKKEYVVAGEKTCCEMTARLNLAKAKYKAAVETLVASKAPASKANSGS
ncbi:MAG: hypothetical protein AAF939_16620 [Planctomycetota bacterium]